MSEGRLAQEVREYLRGSPYQPDRSGRLGRLAGHLPAPLIPPLRSASTRAFLPASRRKFSAVVHQSPLLLDLGCGFAPAAGWVNVDLFGSHADIYWDLRLGLPLPDSCVDGVFHEHLLEHLPMSAGLRLTEECRRVLRPGGVLRVVVPDAGRILEEYHDRDPDLLRRAPTPMIGVQQMFYGWRHVAMYDSETLGALLQAAGFDGVSTCAFGQSALENVPDSESRRHESLYMEAVR